MQDIAVAGRAVLPLWLLAYGVKIYTDFSAYSDIAIGSARLFGIAVPENFDWPYFQTNITDFWRHWHISLSSWLFDYVFIPLGGSRISVPRTYANLLVTMFISGLWHGAGFNFIVWGVLHGLMLAVHRWWRLRPGYVPSLHGYARALSWLLTFACVNLAWAFFCMDTRTALYFFRRLLLG
jgi:alginate O-acetyltransferase complex protein AlgI